MGLVVDRIIERVCTTEDPVSSSMVESFNSVCNISDSIEGPYGMDKEGAARLFQHMWIYTHGIATMCVNGLCTYTPEEISDRLTEVFSALLAQMKSGKA